MMRRSSSASALRHSSIDSEVVENPPTKKHKFIYEQKSLTSTPDNSSPPTISVEKAKEKPKPDIVEKFKHLGLNTSSTPSVCSPKP